MNNTYFAAASWHEDDDSSVCHPRHHNPIIGHRVPYTGGIDKYEAIDHLEEAYVESNSVSTTQKHP